MSGRFESGEPPVLLPIQFAAAREQQAIDITSPVQDGENYHRIDIVLVDEKVGQRRHR